MLGKAYSSDSQRDNSYKRIKSKRGSFAWHLLKLPKKTRICLSRSTKKRQKWGEESNSWMNWKGFIQVRGLRDLWIEQNPWVHTKELRLMVNWWCQEAKLKCWLEANPAASWTKSRGDKDWGGALIHYPDWKWLDLCIRNTGPVWVCLGDGHV